MNNTIDKELFDIYYFQITDIWKNLCEQHSSLYDNTCKEYQHLLSSELEEIDLVLKEKQIIINFIDELDNFRAEIIEDMNSHLSEQDKISNMSDLLGLMITNGIERKEKHLFKFNELLINIIEKIQDQNKINQLFINKAILSLKEIRLDAIGEQSLTTYNAKGSARSSSLSK